MNPKIISIGYSVPENAYTQEEIFAELRYDRHFWPVFRDSSIDKRHFWVPLPEIRSLSWQEQQDRYRLGAVQLSKEAILNCLDGRIPREIACLSFSSCTGFLPGPTAPHYLAHELQLKQDTYLLNIGSMGCEGGFPGLKRASDFSAVTGKTSMAVACELASCSYFPEPDGKPDPENNYELARSNSIFADAAAAVLVGFDHNPRHPEIIDTETYTDTKYLSSLGYTWRQGRLRVLLSRGIPRIAAALVKEAVDKILKRNRLSNIEHWIVHAAGNQVLDKIRDALELPEEKLALSRKVLRTYGNCSSATIGIIGKTLMEDVETYTGEYGLVVSLGPGMTAGCTLLRWP